MSSQPKFAVGEMVVVECVVRLDVPRGPFSIAAVLDYAGCCERFTALATAAGVSISLIMPSNTDGWYYVLDGLQFEVMNQNGKLLGFRADTCGEKTLRRWHKPDELVSWDKMMSSLGQPVTA